MSTFTLKRTVQMRNPNPTAETIALRLRTIIIPCDQSITLTEEVPYEVVQLLSAKFDELPVEFARNKSRESQKMFMRDYKNSMKIKDGVGHIKVTYSPKVSEHLKDDDQVSKLGYGRMYAQNRSLQGIERELRQAIAKDSMYDLDFANAHPNMLLQYCEARNIACDSLRDYVENRQEFFEILEDSLQCTKSEAKQNILKILNNGGKKLSKCVGNVRFQRLCNEFVRIRSKIQELEPELQEEAKKKNPTNVSGSTVSLLLGRIENACLLTVYHKLLELNISVQALVFDGIMVLRKNIVDLESVMRQCGAAVERKTGYTVTIVEKEMDEAVEISPEMLAEFIREQHIIHTWAKNALLENIYPIDHYAVVVKQVYKDNLKFAPNLGFLISQGLWVAVDDCVVQEECKRLLNTHLQSLKDSKQFIKQSTELENALTSAENAGDKEAIKILKEQLKKLRAQEDKYNKLIQKPQEGNGSQDVVKALKGKLLKEDSKFEEKLDQNVNLFVFNNGLIDLKTGEFRDVQPTDYAMLTCGYDYDANNEATYKEFKGHISKILPVTEEFELARKWGFYTLLGNHPEKCMVFATDRRGGYNGKSKFFGQILAAHGNYGIEGDNSLLVENDRQVDVNSHQSGLLGFRFKRAAKFEEQKANKTIDGSQLKRLNGGDFVITGRHAGKPQNVTFTFAAKQMILFNAQSLGHFNFNDKALEKRMLLFVFRSKFLSGKEYEDHKNEEYVYEATKSFEENILLYRSYFIRWCLESREDFWATRFNDVPDTFNQWKAELAREQDNVQKFINNFIVKVSEPIEQHDKTLKAPDEFYFNKANAYKVFSKEDELQQKDKTRITEDEFWKRMQTRMPAESREWFHERVKINGSNVRNCYKTYQMLTQRE